MLAGWQELRALVSGTEAQLTRATVDDVYGCDLYYDSSKARKQLGWTARPAEDVIYDTARWLKHVGMLEPSVVAKLEAMQSGPDWPAM